MSLPSRVVMNLPDLSLFGWLLALPALPLFPADLDSCCCIVDASGHGPRLPCLRLRPCRFTPPRDEGGFPMELFSTDNSAAVSWEMASLFFPLAKKFRAGFLTSVAQYRSS